MIYLVIHIIGYEMREDRTVYVGIDKQKAINVARAVGRQGQVLEFKPETLGDELCRDNGVTFYEEAQGTIIEHMLAEPAHSVFQGKLTHRFELWRSDNGQFWNICDRYGPEPCAEDNVVGTVHPSDILPSGWDVVWQ